MLCIPLCPIPAGVWRRRGSAGEGHRVCQHCSHEHATHSVHPTPGERETPSDSHQEGVHCLTPSAVASPLPPSLSSSLSLFLFSSLLFSPLLFLFFSPLLFSSLLSSSLLFSSLLSSPLLSSPLRSSPLLFSSPFPPPTPLSLLSSGAG